MKLQIPTCTAGGGTKVGISSPSQKHFKNELYQIT